MRATKNLFTSKWRICSHSPILMHVWHLNLHFPVDTRNLKWKNNLKMVLGLSCPTRVPGRNKHTSFLKGYTSIHTPLYTHRLLTQTNIKITWGNQVRKRVQENHVKEN